MLLLIMRYISLNKRVLIITNIIFIYIILALSDMKVIAAGNSDTISKEGKIVFKTIDTKASSGIKWKTVGFTITRDRCLSGSSYNGGYPTKLEHGIVWLNSNNKCEVDLGDGRLEVTFTIPKEVVSKALIKGGLEDIKDNDILYLHGIFQVTHNGKDYGSKKYDLPSIVKAEAWANTNDFKDHFDIKVNYDSDLEPVYIEYRTKAGQIISIDPLPKSKWVKSGGRISVKLSKIKNYNSKNYTIIQSYYAYINDISKKNGIKSVIGSNYENVQNRTEIQKISGIRFVAVMSPPVVEPKPGEIRGELDEPEITGLIGADIRKNEKFNITEGIPSGESVFVNIQGSKYLVQYSFVERKGRKIYPVTIKKTYNLSWEDEKGGKHEDSKTVSELVNVEREYSYWEIKELSIYRIKGGEINNDVLQDGKLILRSKQSDNIPEVLYSHNTSISNHIKDPIYSKIITLNQNVEGKTIPIENFQKVAENEIGEIEVKSDFLKFNKKIIMDDAVAKRKAKKPDIIPVCNYLCDDNMLYSNNNLIKHSMPNGEYKSSGKIIYERVISINSTSDKEISYNIPYVNPVIVHTPVVCDGFIEDKRGLNQMLNPDKTMAGLVLDTNFKVFFSTEGYHRQIQGYGYRDYSKYIYKRQVRFPFDVYIGEKYIPRNTWTPFIDDVQEYYLPVWVDEGKYEIDFKSIGINCIEDNDNYNIENVLANLDIDSYIAVDSTHVEISGRIYGFNIYDISDYPLWRDVFRKEKSIEITGINYRVGINNHNGGEISNIGKNILPIINGSHPYYENKGVLKAGYMTRFSITTVGNMNLQNDYIRIQPRFYHVDKYGKNRKEVDIYYSETFNGIKNHIIKIGSKEDRSNKKQIVTGDRYLSIPKGELLNVSLIENIDMNRLSSKKKNVYTFSNIMIPESLRTYIGPKEIPFLVNKNKAISSMQRWYCEYYLPGNIYVVPKDYNVLGSISENGLNYKEKFWIRDGYIIVNFDIETIKNGERYLSYINKLNSQNGYCNMWKKEGFLYNRKDFEGTEFKFIDGDIVLYYTDNSVKDDYVVGGTH